MTGWGGDLTIVDALAVLLAVEALTARLARPSLSEHLGRFLGRRSHGQGGEEGGDNDGGLHGDDWLVGRWSWLKLLLEMMNWLFLCLLEMKNEFL
jgi:hypothetical protein